MIIFLHKSKTYTSTPVYDVPEEGDILINFNTNDVIEHTDYKTSCDLLDNKGYELYRYNSSVLEYRQNE